MEKKLELFENFLIALCFLQLCIVVLVQIVSREIIGLAIGWTLELTRYSYIWLVFIGMAAGIKNNDHISMTFLRDKCPKKLRFFFIVLSDIFFLIFSGYVLKYGIIFSLQHFWSKKMTTALNIPFSLVSLIIPISFLLATIHLLIKLFKYWDKRNIYL